jgi:hypothetical protein
VLKPLRQLEYAQQIFIECLIDIKFYSITHKSLVKKTKSLLFWVVQYSGKIVLQGANILCRRRGIKEEHEFEMLMGSDWSCHETCFSAVLLNVTSRLQSLGSI